MLSLAKPSTETFGSFKHPEEIELSEPPAAAEGANGVASIGRVAQKGFESDFCRASGVSRRIRCTLFEDTMFSSTRQPALRAGHPGPSNFTSPVITASVLNALSRTPIAIRPLSKRDQRASARRLYSKTWPFAYAFLPDTAKYAK